MSFSRLVRPGEPTGGNIKWDTVHVIETWTAELENDMKAYLYLNRIPIQMCGTTFHITNCLAACVVAQCAFAPLRPPVRPNERSVCICLVMQFYGIIISYVKPLIICTHTGRYLRARRHTNNTISRPIRTR